MYLVLGDSHDPLCAGVRDALAGRGCATKTIASPLLHPVRFEWRLDTTSSSSALVLDDGVRILGDEIDGVFVGGTGRFDPRGWASDDLMYVQSETHAALLAWLWSLDCPVVNRAPASTWYRPNPPLVSWHSRLARAGLPTMDTLVTNVPDTARAFAGGSSAWEDSVVLGPLTSDARYIVSSDDEWRGLVALQRRTPIPLSYPHGPPQFATVVGERIIWAPDATPALARLEPALVAFAADAGLALVEVIFAPVADRLSVIAVDPRPQLDHFDEVRKALITESIADLLTEDVHGRRTAPLAEAVS
jgi:hypothetical protein